METKHTKIMILSTDKKILILWEIVDHFRLNISEVIEANHLNNIETLMIRIANNPNGYKFTNLELVSFLRSIGLVLNLCHFWSSDYSVYTLNPLHKTQINSLSKNLYYESKLLQFTNAKIQSF